jgi:Ca2+-binding EF-hand superfamily protein
MKAISLATALVAATLAFVPPVAYAQKSMDMIKAMDKDKDGMISKAEFMAMMEQKFDMMDKAKTGKLSAQDVAKSIAEIQRVYGSSN